MENRISQTTHSVRIDVSCTFVPEQSDREGQNYFFAYTIRITNEGAIPVQLMNRHWQITDGHGRVSEVKGAGVVGKQPRLEPKETFEYESFCPLPTPTGTMQGTYEMVAETGESFEVAIPTFFLVDPASFH